MAPRNSAYILVNKLWSPRRISLTDMSDCVFFSRPSTNCSLFGVVVLHRRFAFATYVAMVYSSVTSSHVTAREAKN